MKAYIPGPTFPMSGALSSGLLQNEAPELMPKMGEFLIDKGWEKKQRREHWAA